MKRLKNALMQVASNFWQAAFVRPFPPGKESWKTRFVSLASYVFGVFLLIPLMTASLIDDYMTAAIPLEAMHKSTGVLASVTICHKCPQLFDVREPSGQLVEFGAAMDHLRKLKSYVGTEITVWSQKGCQIPTLSDTKFMVNQVYEIRIAKNGEELNHYQAKRGEWIARDDKDHWWFLAFLLVGVWLPVRVVWKHW